MRWRRISGLVVACVLASAGCGASDDSTHSAGEATRQEAVKPTPLPAETVEPSHCPAGHPACRETVGRILYVEANDPDGDGDAHFVILDPQGITYRGITAVDVRADLRPHPLPGPGDLVSAAGPVQTGSFGQSQIHALVLHVGR